MRKKVTDLYLLTTLTNLHAGRGDSNYGIVDNEVQRDPISNYPAVFSSSMKGALRQLLDDEFANDVQVKKDLIYIFGNEVGNAKVIKSGNYVFHGASLVSLPVRAGFRPFLHATTPSLLSDLLDIAGSLGAIPAKQLDSAKGKVPFAVPKGEPQASEPGLIDEFKAGNLSQEAQAALTVFQSTVPILPAPAAFFHDGDFKEICERLPVIARNQLESGISRNLFYEEVVPRQTRFVFFVERPKDHDGLHEYLKKLDFRIQLGANASIGYGVCKIERVFPSSPPKSN